MSKIIVDQVQKNGGDVLTLPSTDATANNQPMVGATNGNLTFSPLALPAADGGANHPVTTDGSGQLQFGAFGLPAATGTSGQFLSSNGTDAVWIAGPSSVAVDSDSDEIIGTVCTDSARGQSYTGDWTSSGPNSTWYAYQALGGSYSDETWNMFLGDGYPNGTSQIMYSNNDHANNHRVMEFANRNRVGHANQYRYYYKNQTSYSGNCFRVMPIRNTGSGSITVTVKCYASSYSNSQYSGSCLGYFTPSNSSGTTYSTVTGGSWSVLAQYDSSDQDYNLTSGASVTVPAGKTVLVMLVSSTFYHTTYQFTDTNYFYDLHTTFSNSDIVCDMRMLTALQMARSTSNTSTTGSPVEIYTACANLFGDR